VPPVRIPAMFLLRTIHGWFLRLLPVALAVAGWHIARWMGVLAGGLIGCVTAIVIWGFVYYVALSTRLKRRLRNTAELPTERLLQLAVDPTAQNMAFAISALQKRGIDARPSLESLCELLTSPESNRRSLGMGLLFGMYPDFWAKIAKGLSSSDSPEVWRTRLVAVRDGG
jgi:hypothetical protein